MRRLVLMALFLAVAFAADAFAWGPDGHVIVCRIAFLELENVPGAQARVDALAALYRDPDGNPVASFAEGCKFPDFARNQVDQPSKPKWTKEFRQFNQWHFLNVSRETFAISPTDYCKWELGPNGEACTSEPQERKLTDSYQDLFDDVVKQRLQQAGVRLAAQLRKGLGL